MAGCHLGYTWQQQSTSYPQVCHKFFKRIRRVQLQAGLLGLSLWFYMKYKLCLLFSDAIRDRTWKIYFWRLSLYTNKTRKSNQVFSLSSSVPLIPLLPWCFSTRMNSDGLGLLSVVPGSQLVSGDLSLPRIAAQATAISSVRGAINHVALHNMIDYLFLCVRWAPVK